MKHSKSRPMMVAYAVAMFVVSTTCLLCTIIYWYKGVWPVLIVVVLGYIASAFIYESRKPIEPMEKESDSPKSPSEWYEHGA